MSLTFYPLYWIYHDGWKFKETKTYSMPDGKGGTITVDKSKEFNQPGHIHFFMPDLPSSSVTTQAYKGEQVYNFKLEDTWGPNSKDPNQAKNITLIGKPIWRFYIEEYWRRIYVQPWDDSNYNNKLLNNVSINKLSEYVSISDCLIKQSSFTKDGNNYSLGGKSFNFSDEDRINYLGNSYFIVSTSILSNEITCDYKLGDVTSIYGKISSNEITYLYYISGNEKRYFTKYSIIEKRKDSTTRRFLPINPNNSIDMIFSQTGEDNDHLKKGIKYDASKPEHSFGPFREGNQFYFFNTVVNRTMPIEYWKDAFHTKRDYYVKDGDKEETSGKQTWSYDAGDIIFKWVTDTHYAYDQYSSWYSSWGYYRMRNNVVYRPPTSNYYYSQVGHNAKRLKQHTPKNESYEIPTKQTIKYNEVLYPIRGEDTDQYSGFEVDGWYGWFEYSGQTFINENTEMPQKHIVFCDPNDSFSQSSYGRYYTEKDETKKIPHIATYYKRRYKPLGYEIDNFDHWTVNLRQYFPCPPPYLNYKDPEDLVQLYWEYLYYFDKVCSHNKEGKLNFEENTWEWFLRKYYQENYKKTDDDFQSSLTLEDYTTCFENFLSEYRNYFFNFEITAPTGSIEFYRQLQEKDEGEKWNYGYDENGEYYEEIIKIGPEMYLTFHEFSREIWNPLSQKEIDLLCLKGDYPEQIKDIPEPPKNDEENNDENESSSSSDFESVFEKDNPFDFTHKGKVNPYDNWLEYFNRKEIYTIPKNTEVKGNFAVAGSKDNYHLLHPREYSYSNEDGARWIIPDDKYVSPVIEYQKIIHSNYERLPQKREESLIYGFDEHNGKWRKDKQGNWGDSFEISVTIPFKINGKVQSPFSDDDKITKPIGVYCHNVVKEENKMRYNVEWFDSLIQFRKYDFPTYVTLIKEFKTLYPDFPETFGEDNEDIENLYNSDRILIDNEGNEIKTPWKDLLNPFFQEKNEQNNYQNIPVTKRNDEPSFDETTGIWRDKVTQNMVTQEQVAYTTDEEGNEVPGYLDSKGNIVKGGNIVQFNNPYQKQTDGKWIEQCLGALVKAEVDLVLQDAVGYRWIETVTATALTSNTPLEGNDS